MVSGGLRAAFFVPARRAELVGLMLAGVAGIGARR